MHVPVSLHGKHRAIVVTAVAFILAVGKHVCKSAALSGVWSASLSRCDWRRGKEIGR